MIHHVAILAWWCLWLVHASEIKTPRIIIVGSGAAGIAAGTRLLEKGFHDLTILEAENRIGGRLHTVQFGGYPVDLGAQWVHGEKGNVIFDLVWPMGLLERSKGSKGLTMFNSSGEKIPDDVASGLIMHYLNLTDANELKKFNKTISDEEKHKLAEHPKDHPDTKGKQQELLKGSMNLMEMTEVAVDTWYNSTKYIKGDQLINWKDKTYGFAIDILLKKFPNPAEESPFRNKTVLNTEVTRIDYSTDGLVRVVTKKGNEYVADHVIVTTSLGVLKADHRTMFNPPLPEGKANAIKNLGYVNLAKIYLYYKEPWWPNVTGLFAANFYWNPADRQAYINDPQKSWLMGVYAVITVEHKPGLLCCWITSDYGRDMEAMPEDRVLAGIKELLQRFMGKTYNLTEPTTMLRTQWYTNKHFRGAFSYVPPEANRTGVKPSQIAEPIMRKNLPLVLFAGEATASQDLATVHGAVSTGWREADRLLQYYGSQKTKNVTL